RYISPEQLFASSAVDPRSDIWSLGCIAYELLVGRPPFDEPSLTRICAVLGSRQPPQPLRQLRAEIPPALEDVVMRRLRYEPRERVPSVADLAGGLLAAIGSAEAAQTQAKITTMLDGAGKARGPSPSLTSAGGTLTGVGNGGTTSSGSTS